MQLYIWNGAQFIPVYHVEDAAAYLGLKAATLRHHVYVSGKLKSCKDAGGRLIFTKEQLDAFAAIPRRAGRPRKPTVSIGEADTDF